MTMAYQLLTAGKRTEITDLDKNVRMAVFEKDKNISPADTAYCLATQYKVKGGFIPEKIFIFQTTAVVEVNVMKQAIDFFFLTLLETELYVKEVLRDSVLFPQESANLFGSPILAA